MKDLEFPIIGTKVKGLNKKFDLNNPKERLKYFEAKTGSEVEKLKNYLKTGTFVAYMLGKKNSGKGTYSQIFTEIFGDKKVELVSVGDLVRNTHANWDSFKKSEDFKKLKSLYRGYISFDEAVDSLLGRSTSGLLPTEFVLALLKLHIEKIPNKALFIDGLPRETDQVSYSLYFRDLIAYRNDPDFFVLIDIPEKVIDERIKFRVVCPECRNTRNIKLLPTSKVKHDAETNEFYLFCDSPRCKGGFRMVGKEGDDLGIDPIRGRLVKDEEILKQAFSLHGIPKVLLRNHVPVSETDKNFDKYEVTPEYSYKLEEGKVKVIEKPWTFKDDNGIESVSLLAAPVVVSMIKQMADILG